MIKQFLMHHIARISNAAAPLNALHNCHVRGVDSIVLHDEPGNRIRLFRATEDHQLFHRAVANTSMENWNDANPDMTLAIHSHHCDVRLIRLTGKVTNDTFEMEPDEAGDFYECEYRSAITTGTHGYLHETGRRFKAGVVGSQGIGEHGISMAACELHSIYVPPRSTAAWLVIEGEEDLDYKPICYTANPHWDSAGFYVPMERHAAASCLRRVLHDMGHA